MEELQNNTIFTLFPSLVKYRQSAHYDINIYNFGLNRTLQNYTFWGLNVKMLLEQRSRTIHLQRALNKNAIFHVSIHEEMSIYKAI